jgi:hypothetical protein
LLADSWAGLLHGARSLLLGLITSGIGCKRELCELGETKDKGRFLKEIKDRERNLGWLWF